jgi:WD40 repeat protein
MSADKRRVLTGSGDGTARLWDAETGAQLHSFKEGGATVTAVALSPDGRLAAAARRHGKALGH